MKRTLFLLTQLLKIDVNVAEVEQTSKKGL